MEAIAKSRYNRLSAQKARLVANEIRGYSLLLEMTFWLPIDIGLMVGDSPYAR